MKMGLWILAVSLVWNAAVFAQEKILDTSSGSVAPGTTHPNVLLPAQNMQKVSGWTESSPPPLIGNMATGDIHPASSAYIVSLEKVYSVTEYMELKKDRDQWKSLYDSALLSASQSEADKRMIVSSLFSISLSGDLEKLRDALRRISSILLFGDSQSEGLKNKNQ